MDQKIPHTLLAKHFVNQTSVEESEEVRRWRAQSPENEKLYQEYLHEWEIAHADFSRFVLPDSDKMWGNILSRINEPVKTILYTKKKLYKAIAVAASIALLVGLSFSVWLSAYYRSDGNYLAAEAVFIVPSGQKSQLILPDGTKVWMNSDSKLTYPVDFSKKRRLVKLEGEAYFDVVHDENNKFIVNTGTVNVLVHGTSFSVTDYPTDSFISVALEKGSVSVETSREHDLLTRLVPGQKLLIAKSDISWNVSAFDAECCNLDQCIGSCFKNHPNHPNWAAFFNKRKSLVKFPYQLRLIHFVRQSNQIFDSLGDICKLLCAKFQSFDNCFWNMVLFCFQ